MTEGRDRDRLKVVLLQISEGDYEDMCEHILKDRPGRPSVAVYHLIEDCGDVADMKALRDASHDLLPPQTQYSKPSRISVLRGIAALLDNMK